MHFRSPLLSVPLLFAAAVVMAQGAPLAFGPTGYDASLPVEVTADQLQIDQNGGSATFTGNVVVGQGDLRLTGAVVDVTYAVAGAGQVERVHARGGVTLATATEAAEATEAVYTLATGEVVLTGDVVVTQGQNAMAGERLTVQLATGTGVIEGRVRVIFRPEPDQTPETGQ